MYSMQSQWIRAASSGLLWCLIFIFVRGLLLAIPSRKRRRLLFNGRHSLKKASFPPVVMKLLWIPKPGPLLNEMKQLLLGCGFSFDSLTYFMMKRLLLLFILVVGSFGYFMLKQSYTPFSISPVYLIILCAAAGILVLFDKPMLETIKKLRRERMLKEVYVLSKQLLYYEGSSMNLHNKLIRCIPHTRILRNEMLLLTNEWYHDSETAINRFKERLGTEEGFTFGETIHSLQQNESERYYDLLRQRIQDYKEKMELAKESKKETTSYVLFILSGIPILNTFRVFIYPWIAEGQKLFDSLS